MIETAKRTSIIKVALGLLAMFGLVMALLPSSAWAYTSTYKEHVAKTWTVGSGNKDSTGVTTYKTNIDTLCGKVLFKGDTIQYVPDEATPTGSSGGVFEPYVGFQIIDAGETDITTNFATMTQKHEGDVGNTNTIYQGVTITSDNPIHIQYKGAWTTGDNYYILNGNFTYKNRATYYYLQTYENSYSLGFDLADGIVYDDTYPTDLTTMYVVDRDDAYTITLDSLPVKAGYNFYRWDVPDTCRMIENENGGNLLSDKLVIKSPIYGGSNTMIPSQNTVLTAIYSSQYDSYNWYGTVELDARGGKIEGYDTKLYEVTQDNVNKFDYASYVPVKNGYTFQGWYLDEALTQQPTWNETYSYSNLAFTSPYDQAANRNVHLYAKWSTSASPVDRLSGGTALDTMAAITKAGWNDGSCHTVIVATMDGYWDALSASALAGFDGNSCPVLITSGTSLSKQTADEIKRLGADRVYIAGGTAAVSKGVESSIKALAGVKTVTRLAGDNAVGTSLKIYQEGKGSWGTTAIIATNGGYWDALAASPYAYSKHAPIFLYNSGTGWLDASVVAALRDGGFTKVMICGGKAAVSGTVEGQLKGLGSITSVKRYGGATAVETSALIAQACLDAGMTANNVGIATVDGYWDALTGAAMCGKNDAPLVLVSGANRSSITGFIHSNRADITQTYVFGGTSAVSAGTYNALVAALK